MPGFKRLSNRTSQDCNEILHDELWYSHSASTFQIEAEVIKDVQEGRGPAGVDLSDVRVRIYGNTAHVKTMSVVRGRNAGKGGGGKSGPAPLLVVHVLVKGPEGWQLVSRQATRPTPPAAGATAGR